MESTTRNVRDLDGDDRRSLEHVVGRKLDDNQQVIIQIVTPRGGAATGPQPTTTPPFDQLPGWCNVYEGLTEEEIDDLESVILQRANLTRPTE